MSNLAYQPKIPSARFLLIAHFLICSIGLIVLLHNTSRPLSALVTGSLNIFATYRPWAEISSSPSKPAELIQYALSVITLIIYYGFSLFVVSKSSLFLEKLLKRMAPSRLQLTVYFLALFLLNIALMPMHGPLEKLVPVVWALILLCPLFPFGDSLADSISKNQKIWRVPLLLLIIGSTVSLYIPYLFGDMAVSNDYMDIPERTKLSSGVVDNTDYINTHRIGGLNKYDPRTGKGHAPASDDGEYITIKKNEALSRYVKANQERLNYDEETGLLTVNGQLTKDEANDIANLMNSDSDRALIYAFYSSHTKEQREKRNYSAEEIEFIRKNKREFYDQALAGHYFHHQHTMLGTINEYLLGKPRKETVFLYGWLSTVVVAEITSLIGGISFESFTKSFYAFYPIYYLATLMVAALIFRSFFYVLFIGLAAVGALHMVGFETIRFAPGYNPIRHFFDIFALFAFYRYLFAKNLNNFYLAVALVLSLAGILFCKEFGIALLLSQLGAIIFKIWIDRRISRVEIVLIAVALCSVIAITIAIPTAKNPTLLYVLMGVASPPTSQVIVYGILMMFSALYMLLVMGHSQDSKWRVMFLFWFLYTQGVLIYYIWNPSPHHFLSLGVIWSILLALTIKLWINQYLSTIQTEKKLLLFGICFFSTFLFVPGLVTYYFDKHEYQQVFVDHEVHKWNFRRAGFLSTMEPDVFENAVGLIRKYEESPSIHLLSKYDNILPFLAEKYSAMPFTEMALSLVTEKEMKLSVEQLRSDNPEYIFVDTDIKRSHLGDVYDEHDPVSIYAMVFDASKGRAMVLDNLRSLFERIEESYEPVEIGQLITVYKRNDEVADAKDMPARRMR